MTVIEKLRRMIDEPTEAIYTDATLSGYLSETNNDTNAVASEIWSEKAAALQATTYDLSADNASYSYSQKIENALALAKLYASKRLPQSSQWVKDPVEPNFDIFRTNGFYDSNAIVNETYDGVI